MKRSLEKCPSFSILLTGRKGLHVSCWEKMTKGGEKCEAMLLANFCKKYVIAS